MRPVAIDRDVMHRVPVASYLYYYYILFTKDKE